MPHSGNSWQWGIGVAERSRRRGGQYSGRTPSRRHRQRRRCRENTTRPCVPHPVHAAYARADPETGWAWPLEPGPDTAPVACPPPGTDETSVPDSHALDLRWHPPRAREDTVSETYEEFINLSQLADCRHPLFQFDLRITRAILPRLLTFCYSSSRAVGRESRAQSAHRVGDFGYCRAAKAQDEPWARGGAEIGRREWPQPQILACGSCRYNAVTVSFWQCHSQMQARLGTVHLQDGIEFFPDAVDKDLSPLPVPQPHSPDVSREVPLLAQIREHALISPTRAHVHSMANHKHPPTHARAHDHLSPPPRQNY